MWPFTQRGRDAPNTQSAHDMERSSPPVRLLDWIWKPHGDRSLSGSEAVFAAVTRLANTLAATPLHLYNGRRIAYGDPLETLISVQPSPNMTQHLLLQQAESCRDTNGNAYILKVPDLMGRVQWLDVLEPHLVEPKRDKDTGEIWYKISPPDSPRLYVHSREMIHLRHVSAGGLKGVSPIAVLADTLDYDNQMKAFSVAQVKGVNSCVVLEIPTDLSGSRKEQVIKEFTGHYNSTRGNVIVATGGTKASVLAKSPVDSKVLDVERITRNRVASVYNLPPHMLGDFTGTSYTSQEQSMLEFLSTTMTSIYRMYETEYDLKLLTAERIAKGYHFGFDRDALLMTDMAARTAYYQSMIRSGVMTVNEVRGKVGLDDQPDGNVLLCSKDLAPLKWVSTRNPAN